MPPSTEPAVMHSTDEASGQGARKMKDALSYVLEILAVTLLLI